MGIDGVSEALELQYKNSCELNAIVDGLSEGQPAFIHEEVELAGETYDIYFCDVIACARALYGNPEFTSFLVFKPEKHYRKDTNTCLYHDMHTGRWWWATQDAVEANSPGATIIPIIISSDKTQVMLFGNKSAYPIYMTIGNLPKEIRSKPSRQGYILLGYIPVTKLSQISSKASRCRALLNLTHAALTVMLEPLQNAGQTGLPFTSGDGETCKGHPILAAHIGDYLEQIAITAIKFGECPQCYVPRDKLGKFNVEYDTRDLMQCSMLLIRRRM